MARTASLGVRNEVFLASSLAAASKAAESGEGVEESSDIPSDKDPLTTLSDPLS
eukprot:CAMPEP_0197453698 /NCGR_PEP_ID=MMETSP1175-20131217/35747_1 /TAXON_ID=1003142 /ORGANISM="Triceratium dubium, Strain CCMP147" /LENGTH=53 /DNA_ID=CAMNT_0042987069 /DNA_START=59 /DNA_END=220 /DNA_ORIENTATION=-